MWQDFFYFSKKERQGILILLVFIGGIFLGKLIFSSTPEPLREENFPTETKSLIADSTIIKKEKEEKKTFYTQKKDTLRRPSFSTYPKTEKFKEGTIIELNTADTAKLKKIPGIGSGYAKRIVNYRNLLGGYYRIEQLQEVYGMYEELYEKIIPYLSVDSIIIQQIPANSSSLDKLKAHPYINFYQAKAILEIRKKNGKVENIDELKLLEEFTENDLQRLEYYLSF